MADKEAPDRNIYLSCVIRIQALIRGALVRKQIEDVKKSFEDLFQELEGNDTQQVDWENLLCVPKIVKKTSQKERKKVKPLTAGKQKISSVQEEHSLHPVKDDICVRADTGVNDDSDSPRFNSVEVQTSFIDVNNKLPAEQLNESPEHEYNHGDRVLDDLDTSWKDRVVPFIQNNFNDCESEDRENKVEDFHLDLNSERESLDGLGSKSENSTRGSLKHSPREVESNLYQSTHGSVKSLNDDRKQGLEDSEEINNSNAPRKSELRSRSSDSSNRRLDVDANDDRECRYSNRSEHGSSRSKSGPRYHIAYDEDDKLKDDFEHDRMIEKDSASENSRLHRSAPVSDRSQKSVKSEINNELDSPKAQSSRSRTSNKSEKSSHSKTYSDKLNGKPTNRSRNTDRSSNHEMSDGKAINTGRSDRSSERRQHSDRSDRSSERKQHSNRSDRLPERGQTSDRSDRLPEHGQTSDRSDRLRECGQTSDRSDRLSGHGRFSNRSDKSTEGEHFSDKSGGRSRASSTSSHKSGGRKNYEQSAKKAVDVLHPPRSSVSPVNFHTTSADNKPQIQDSTTLTNVTSVWDSFNSMRGSQSVPMSGSLPEDVTSLRELRKNVSMELLWVQQAIDSRKNYLKLKGKM